MRESPDALRALTEAVGTATRADAAVLRLREEETGDLVAHVVWSSSAALRAELVGSRHRPAASPETNGSVLRVPIRQGAEIIGELELVRLGERFGTEDSNLAHSAAARAAVVLATELGAGAGEDAAQTRRQYELTVAAEALALSAGGNAGQLVQLAIESCGAAGALLWRTTDEGSLALAVEVSVENPRISELERAAAGPAGRRDAGRSRRGGRRRSSR